MVRRRSVALAGAALLALCPAPALSQPKPADAVTEATNHFFNGQKLYEQKKFEEALGEFRASYAASPSPNSRLYVARCLRALGRFAAAYEEYAHVILEAGDRSAADKKYAATQQAATEERAALKDKVAIVSVVVPSEASGATVRVGSEQLPPARWGQEVAVDAGSVTVKAEAPGRKPFEKVLEIKAGEKQAVNVELPEGTGTASSGSGETGGSTEVSGSSGGISSWLLGDSSAPVPLRPIALASAGVGVAGLVLWGVFGMKASSRYDELDAKCPGRCDPSLQDDVDAGRTETTVSNVGLAIGIVGIAAGATLFTLDMTYFAKKPSSSAGSSGGSTKLYVAPSPTSPYVAVGGAF